MKVVQKVLNQKASKFAFLVFKELKNGKLNKIEAINDEYDYEKFVDKIVDISDVDSREELENADAENFKEKLFYFNDTGRSKEYVITEIILDLDYDKIEEIAELVQDKLDEYKITENHKDVDFDFVLKHLESGNINLVLNFNCEKIKDISLNNEIDMLNELFIDDNIFKLTSHNGVFYTNEAIEELESLQNRKCENCKHYSTGKQPDGFNWHKCEHNFECKVCFNDYFEANREE